MSPHDDEDQSLWQQAIRDVKQLEKRESHINTQSPIQTKIGLSQGIRVNPTIRSSAAKEPKVGKGLDGRTARRFEQGQMEIDGRIDLHGKTLPAAHQAVLRFIKLQYEAGSRCLLVITGKGEREDDGPWYETSRGGIRRNLLQWLEQPELADFILSVSPARPPHGGNGAFYVLLRRKR